MISILTASSAEDFEIADKFARDFGEWDMAAGLAHGISPEIVLDLYHGDTLESLISKFTSPESKLFVARWNGDPAGCIAFEPFDSETVELHKFYVDPAFRGKGIGRALMQAALSEIGTGARRQVFVHTTIYMNSAVSLYESFDFQRCAPFKDVPESIRHTELFLSRAL